MSIWTCRTSANRTHAPSHRTTHRQDLRSPHRGLAQRRWESFPPFRGPWDIVRLTMVGLFVAGMVGCGATHVATRTATVHEIQIQQEISPRMLHVRTGDEIRWHNLLSSPVQIGILGTKWQDYVMCEKGFKQFGQVMDLVMIQPQEHVSLCFSKVGTVQYNVWLDPKNLTGSMSSTATIRID
jgi:hypothetical protein